MAQFASASFTAADGTTLATADANWTLHPSYTGTAQIAANRVRQSGSITAAYYHSGSPASADYSVSADLFTKEANGGNSFVGVLGRVNTAANTFYMARYSGGASDLWELHSAVSGTFTLLGSSAASLADETTYNVKLEMIGSAIKLYKEGETTALLSVTNTAITAAGKAGMRLLSTSTPSDTTGLHIDNFSADDVATGTHTTTGALTGPGASIVGAALHPHVTAGALAGQGSAVAGTAAAIHETTGALTGPGAAVVGASIHLGVHATTGAVVGSGAAIVGAAVHSGPKVSTGVLAGAGASVLGSAVHESIFRWTEVSSASSSWAETASTASVWTENPGTSSTWTET